MKSFETDTPLVENINRKLKDNPGMTLKNHEIDCVVRSNAVNFIVYKCMEEPKYRGE